jgi:MFS family permease
VTSKSDDELRTSWSELLTPAYATPLALVCLGIWLHAADELVIATLTPSMVAELGGAELISWMLALYEMGSIISGALSALAAMRFGVRLPMTFAAVLFGFGCAASAVAPSMWVVLSGRLMQGLGGGMLLSMSYVAIALFFPRRLAALAVGAFSALWGLAAFSGPLIGGVFAELGMWRGGFWFFGLQAWGLAAWMFISVRDRPTQNPARPASGFPARRLAALSLAILLISCAGIASPPALMAALVVCGVACLALFFRLDARKGPHRLFPRPALSFHDSVGAGMIMVIMFSVGTVAIGIYGPLLIMRMHGVSALTAGYILAGAAIGWTIVALIVANAPERHDRTLIICGILIVAATIPAFVYAVPNGPVWLIAAIAAIQGGGNGLSWAFILRRAGALAPPGETERIAAALPTIHRIGFAVGAAFLGIVANSAGLEANASPELAASVSRAVFLASLPPIIIGVIAALRFIRPPN